MKKITVGLLVLALCLLSCVALAEDGTRTITDILGREVEIPESIESVVALGSAARMMTYARCTDRIIGVSEAEKNADAGMPFAYVNHDAFANCASVASGGNGDTVFTEEVVAAAPDMIFYFGADVETLDALQAQVEIPVVGLFANNFYDPQFIDSLTLIGEIMGNQEHVEQVTSAVQGWIADLNDRTKDIPDDDKPTVYMGACGFKGPHGFEGTYANYPPFVAINARNVSDETGEKAAFLVDLEKVAVWDPEIIFLDPSHMNMVNADYATNAAFYDNLSAVKAGRVYTQIAFNYYMTNHELAIVDAYYAGTIIFPEQFADVDFAAKADEIFNVMLGSDYLATLEDAGLGFGTITIGE